MQELVILLAAHFIADFPLQGEWMAKEKYRAFKTDLGTIALFAHAFIQAMVVASMAVLVGMPFTPIFWVVGTTHFFIDWGKIRGWYEVLIDQLLHYLILGLLVLFL